MICICICIFIFIAIPSAALGRCHGCTTMQCIPTHPELRSLKPVPIIMCMPGLGLLLLNSIGLFRVACTFERIPSLVVPSLRVAREWRILDFFIFIVLVLIVFFLQLLQVSASGAAFMLLLSTESKLGIECPQNARHSGAWIAFGILHIV